jgi:iron complex transport system substrate-binding protein
MGRGAFFAMLGICLAAGLAAGCGESAPPAGPAPEAGKPLRILSLTPNITEILFAMGLGDKVVGRSTYCNYPPEAAALPAVGDTLKMNLEKIIALHPTLAFVVTKRPDTARTLEGLGIRTVTLRSDKMEELLASIETIGRETGTPEAARALVDRLRSGLDAVRRRVAGRLRPTVLFAFPMTVGLPQMMVAGRGTFVDELLSVAGGVNAFPDAADWPTVTPQRVIALAPEIVIVNATGEDAAPDRIEAIRRAWANWTSVPAVSSGRVTILTDPYLTIPGPRVGLAAARLAEIIHPEVFRPAGSEQRGDAKKAGWYAHAAVGVGMFPGHPGTCPAKGALGLPPAMSVVAPGGGRGATKGPPP